ncbi:pyridoxal-phosphate dependent enzyme [Leucothrix sargassi]|nr:pyridoxal-phosphate dependent enzyme [Leucothrix sargassi]
MKIHWQNSIIDRFTFEGQEYLVKRDDLITPLNGNKARKLYGLLHRLESKKYTRVVSHGGTQSNAMLAIAQLCQLLSIEFHYTTRPAPKWLRQSPNGNLKAALACGMHWHINDSGAPEQPQDEQTLFIPQGIAMPEAALGIQKLAEEIKQYCGDNQLDDIAIVQPSGTGTTALYLQQYLPYTVYTVPCIGDTDTLKALFKQQLPDSKRYPVILDTDVKYHFGEPHKALLQTHQAVVEASGIEFELMYDAKTWLILKDWTCDLPILYIHNGGISGNESMLGRYKRLGLLS